MQARGVILRDTCIDRGGCAGLSSRHARVTRKVLHGAEKALACQSTPVLQPKSKPGFVVWGSFHWFSAESRHGQASSHRSPSCKIPRPLSFLHLSLSPLLSHPSLLIPSGPDPFPPSLPSTQAPARPNSILVFHFLFFLFFKIIVLLSGGTGV